MAIKSANKHQRNKLFIDEFPANGPVPCTVPLIASRDVIRATLAAPIVPKRSALHMTNGKMAKETGK
jgi:hypothetical protein